MKKFIFLFIILSFNATQCMYTNGTKLKYSEVKLTNKASIPLEISWYESPDSNKQPNLITQVIKPSETIMRKLGQSGAYVNRPGKVTYNPIPGNEAFKQEFEIDLPSAPAWAFTAVKLADILNNILVPGVFKADEKGNFSSFQYMNVQHPSQWEKAILEAGKAKPVK